MHAFARVCLSPCEPSFALGVKRTDAEKWTGLLPSVELAQDKLATALCTGDFVMEKISKLGEQGEMVGSGYFDRHGPRGLVG